MRRFRSLTLGFWTLSLIAAHAVAAPPKASGKKGRAPADKSAAPAGDKAAPGSPAAGSAIDSPYGAGSSTAPAAAPAAAPAEGQAAPGTQAEPSPESPTAPADPALEKPPPAATQQGGPKLSPLNPEPEEFPRAEKTASTAELTRLLSDIAALRSRVAALTTSLFSSKVRVFVRVEGDDARIDALALTLDDGVVYRAPAKFIADEDRVVFEHAVAPGNHVFGFQIERHDARGSAYKTWQQARFSVIVPDKQLLELELLVEDDSDMAEDFPDDREGQYELGVRLRARVVD